MRHRVLRTVLGILVLVHPGCGGRSPASTDPGGAGRLPSPAPLGPPGARGPVGRSAASPSLQLRPAGRRGGGPPDERGRAGGQGPVDGLHRRFDTPQPPAARELHGSQPAAHRLLGLSDRRPGLLRLAHSPGPLGSRAGVPAVHPAARAVGRGAGPRPVSRLSLLACRNELRVRGRLPGLALGPRKPVVPRHRGDGHLGGHGHDQGPRTRDREPPVPVRPLDGRRRRLAHRPPLGRHVGRPRDPRRSPPVRYQGAGPRPSPPPCGTSPRTSWWARATACSA